MLPEGEQPSIESLLEHIARDIVPIYHQSRTSAKPAENSVKESGPQVQLTNVLKEISKFIKKKPLDEVINQK